ncbi:hypothetical protein [Acidisphaera sp. L21]|uniref:hypothetical protein n=1 Tax=Acidisphaera sp. L21 TaxID=1641851 RepID=UPI0020B15DFD|nr:hypothetical protein [Acidisphaera sp. L21]
MAERIPDQALGTHRRVDDKIVLLCLRQIVDALGAAGEMVQQQRDLRSVRRGVGSGLGQAGGLQKERDGRNGTRQHRQTSLHRFEQEVRERRRVFQEKT